MADTEILVETATCLNVDDIKKIGGTEKMKAVNGVSAEEKNDLVTNMENGNITPCKSPQLNGDIRSKSPTASDGESKEKTLKNNIVENKSVTEIEKNGDDKISINHSDINNGINKCEESTTRSNLSPELIKSELNDVEVSDETLELTSDTVKDKNSAESVKSCVHDENKADIKESLGINTGSEDCQSSGSVNSSDKIVDFKKEDNACESKVDSDTDLVKEDCKENEEISVVEKDKSEKSPTKRAKKNESKVDLPKRITRSSSGISKAVKYSDAATLGYDDYDDDDDIKITKEVKKKDEVRKKDEESDIEMIEECDPLAISDADVIKAKEAVKEHVGVSSMKPHLKIKQSKMLGASKKDSNVIIIDTNTLLKQQGTIAASAHTTSKTPKAPSVSASAQTTSAGTTITPAAQIQNAIQAITGGNPAIQGLQSAYLSAIQQVLLAQGGGQVSNPHYLAQLQQYYNTLGALQDDAYVIEAPSFIVPYVMEGKPVESIKDYLEKINKEFAENEKKKLEIEKKPQEEKSVEDSKLIDTNNEKLDTSDKENSSMEVTETSSEDKNELKDSPSKDKVDSTSSEADKSEDDSEEKKICDSAKTDEDEKGSSEETDEIEKSPKEKDPSKSAIEKKETPDVKKTVNKDTEKADENEKSIIEQDNKKQDKEDEKMALDKENEETKEVVKTSEKLEKEDKSTDNSDDCNKENKNSTENKVGKKEEEIIDLDNEEETAKKECFKHLGRWESYYKSALGRFFLDLGLNHAQEFIQADLLKMQKRKLEKMKSNPSKQDILGVKVLESQLKTTKRKNEHLSIPLKTCKFCSFKTESQLVMERHLESPHMINYTYKCNFCEFETRAPQVILFHTEAEHNVRGRLERAPAFFQCAICPYEDNNKSKMTRHALSCIKKFKPDKNCDLSDWEPPAKIPKIQRGRPNTFSKTFESLKMPNVGMMPKNLSGLGLNTIQTALSGGLLASGASSHVNSLVGRGRGRPVGSYKTISQSIGVRANNASLMYQNRAAAGLLQQIPGVTSAQQLSIANQVLQSVTQGGNRVPRIMPTSGANNIIPGLAASSSITIQSVQNKTGSNKSPQQPSISITPLPRGGSQPSNTKSSSSNSARPAFVICEICDGYIKDLEQLRNHMNLIHKVKIHPKMIYNRPPLNCQKCQHRFFTDQGLERHLLGTHGLVTSSMQEAANKGKDAGRCPICGKVFQWKLLNHVSRDHKMTLKPAHLSYKCTVCTATFNMYRLFENHVYSAHSVVNKNKNNENVVNNSSTPKKPTEVAPMKINDEITIIPQPASKNTNKGDGKSSPRKSESPSVSKEITITKVGTNSRRRSGGGVEVISLDDSPQKRQLEEPPKKKSRETSTSKRARTST